MKRLSVCTALIGSLALIPAVASAAPITFYGSGSGLSAQATFTISGNTLTILLENTDTAPGGTEWGSAEALTGLFFSLGGAALTPSSATITAGTLAQAAICNPGPCDSTTTNVGGEFGYGFTYPLFPTGATHGISSTGAFTPLSSASFGGDNLDNPVALNGANFGIMPSTFVDGSGNGGLDNDPLIRGSVTLVLTGVAGLTEAGIGNVWFTYGTSTTEPRLPGDLPCGLGAGGCVPLTTAPEPGSLILLGTGLIGAARGLRRRFRK